MQAGTWEVIHWNGEVAPEDRWLTIMARLPDNTLRHIADLTNTPKEEDISNAYLMAAAPLMADALKACRNVFDALADGATFNDAMECHLAPGQLTAALHYGRMA